MDVELTLTASGGTEISGIGQFVTLLCAWIRTRGEQRVTAAQLGVFYAAHPSVDRSVLPATKKLEYLCGHAEARGRLKFQPDPKASGGGWLEIVQVAPAPAPAHGAEDAVAALSKYVESCGGEISAASGVADFYNWAMHDGDAFKEALRSLGFKKAEVFARHGLLLERHESGSDLIKLIDPGRGARPGLFDAVQVCKSCRSKAGGRTDTDGVFYCNSCWNDWTKAAAEKAAAEKAAAEKAAAEKAAAEKAAAEKAAAEKAAAEKAAAEKAAAEKAAAEKAAAEKAAAEKAAAEKAAVEKAAAERAAAEKAAAEKAAAEKAAAERVAAERVAAERAAAEKAAAEKAAATKKAADEKAAAEKAAAEKAAAEKAAAEKAAAEKAAAEKAAAEKAAAEKAAAEKAAAEKAAAEKAAVEKAAAVKAAAAKKAADEKAAAAKAPPPPPGLKLEGGSLPGQAANYIGTYLLDRSKLVNGRPAFQHTSDATLWIAFDGDRWIGCVSALGDVNMGHLYLQDSAAASPDVSAYTWQASAGGASAWVEQPQLKCTAWPPPLSAAEKAAAEKAAAEKAAAERAAAEKAAEEKAAEEKAAAVKVRVEEKARRALEEDGFALRPMLVSDASVLRSLEALLQTEYPEWLGKGKDVSKKYGPYDSLKLACAWKVDHPRNLDKYTAGVKRVQEEMDLLKKKGKDVDKVPGLPVRTARAAAEGFTMKAGANEAILLHGTSPDRLLELLSTGLNERYSGTNAGTAFGEGVYLAEDVGKTDQYVGADSAYDPSNELHKRLYGRTVRHPGDVFYVLVVRAALGYPVRTQQVGQMATSMDNLTPIFPIGYRELSEVHGVTPPIVHHSLIAELGPAIARYREFVLFHSEYVHIDYLIAYHRCNGGQKLSTATHNP